MLPDGAPQERPRAPRATHRTHSAPHRCSRTQSPAAPLRAAPCRGAEPGPTRRLCPDPPGRGPAALPQRARPAPPAGSVIVNGRTMGTSARSAGIKAPPLTRGRRGGPLFSLSSSLYSLFRGEKKRPRARGCAGAAALQARARPRSAWGGGREGGPVSPGLGVAAEWGHGSRGGNPGGSGNPARAVTLVLRGGRAVPRL